MNGLISRSPLTRKWPNDRVMNKIALLSLLLIICLNGNGQTVKNDREFLLASRFEQPRFDQRKLSMMKVGKHWYTRYNPISLTFSGLLFFYQKVLSPQISSGCSYEISCSAFSKQCIQEFGLIKGIALSSDRLSRCNRIAAYDISPINVLPGDKIYDPLNRYQWHGSQKKTVKGGYRH